MNKFIKYANVLLLSVSTGVVSYGKKVDENTAKTIGCNFLISKNIHGVNSVSDITTSYVASAQVNGNAVTDFYVFNIAGAKGFVMVSGDDNVTPILAYSDESSFDINNISPSTRYWINGYQSEINTVLENNVPAQEGTSEKWNELMTAKRNVAARTTAVTPLLGTLAWDQEPGYNTFCPPGTPTGCVATCVAQVMKFWNWPTVGCGYHSYTHPVYGLKSADFGNTAYNWSGMPLTSSNNAIALLMFHIGVAVNMNYTTTAEGSGAYTTIAESPIVNCSEYALKTYFHYKRSLHGVERSGPSGTTPDGTWIPMLQAELNAGRPMLYSGQGSDGGHAWVCDGWETSGNKFHFNWGWSGSSNGYYTVDNLAPPALGTGGGGAGNNFNSNQAVIMGIQPDSFASATGNIQLLAHLDCTTDVPANYVPASFSVTTKILNANSTTFKGDFSAQVFDTLNNLVGIMQTLTSQSINAGDSTASLTFTNTATLYKMIPGNYNVRVMYRATGTSTWTAVANNGTFINENVLTIGNNQTVELATPISITSTGGIDIIQGSSLSLNTTVINQTSGVFNGTIEAVLTNVTDGTTHTVQSLPGQTIFYLGTSSTLTFGSAITIPVGYYTLSIQHQFNGSGPFAVTGSDYHENPVIVKVTVPAGVSATSVADEKIVVYPNPANDVININMQGVSVNQIRITDIQGREVQKLIPDNNQTTISVPVRNFTPGIYFVNLYSGNEVITRKIVITK